MYHGRRFLTTTSFPLCSNYSQFSLLCRQREPTGQGGCRYLVGFPFLLFFLPFFLVGLISTRTNSFFLLSPQVFPSSSWATYNTRFLPSPGPTRSQLTGRHPLWFQAKLYLQEGKGPFSAAVLFIWKEPTGQGGCCYLVGYPFLLLFPFFCPTFW